MYQRLQMKKDVSCEFENFRKFSYLVPFKPYFFQSQIKSNQFTLFWLSLWSPVEPPLALTNAQSLKGSSTMTSTLNSASSQYKSFVSNRDPKYRIKSRELLKAYAIVCLRQQFSLTRLLNMNNSNRNCYILDVYKKSIILRTLQRIHYPWIIVFQPIQPV